MTTRNDAMDAIIASLREQEATLESSVATIATEFKGAEAKLKSIRAALGQLTGNGKKSNAGRKPSPTTAEVAKVVTSLLRGGDGELSNQQLRAKVEQELATLGRSKFGLSSRLDEVLASARFEKTQTGVRITASKGPEQ